MPLSSRIRRRRITYGSGPVVPVPPGKTAPGSPTAVVATNGGGSLLVDWTAPSSNGGSPITNYLVQYSSNSGLTWTDFPAGMYPTPTYLIITGLTDGTAYVIRVIARNAVGYGLPSASSASTTPLGVPGWPTSLVVVSGNAQLAVSWAAPAYTGGSNITDYLVHYSSNDGVTNTNFAHAASTATSRTVTGLTNGTAYVITVYAVNAIGTSPPSTPSAPVTPAGSPVVVAPTVPGPPTGVAGLFGNAQVAVSWTAPSSNGGSPITNYLVYYSSNNGSTWTNFAHAVSTATSITVTGLTNTVAYVFKAIAVNSVGNSVSSANSASVTPVSVIVLPPTIVAYDVAVIRPLYATLDRYTGFVVPDKLYFPVQSYYSQTPSGFALLWLKDASGSRLYPRNTVRTTYPLHVVYSRSTRLVIWGFTITRFTTQPEAGWSCVVGEGYTSGGPLDREFAPATNPKTSSWYSLPTNFKDSPEVYKMYESGSYNVSLSKSVGMRGTTPYQLMNPNYALFNVAFYLKVRFKSPTGLFSPNISQVCWANEWDAAVPMQDTLPFVGQPL